MIRHLWKELFSVYLNDITLTPSTDIYEISLRAKPACNKNRNLAIWHHTLPHSFMEIAFKID